MKSVKRPRIFLTAFLLLLLANCSILETEKKENVYFVLYQPEKKQELCGEFQLLGNKKYKFLKWWPLAKCNGLFCSNNVSSIPENVFKPSPTPKPTPSWNDNGQGGQGWGDK